MVKLTDSTKTTGVEFNSASEAKKIQEMLGKYGIKTHVEEAAVSNRKF